VKKKKSEEKNKRNEEKNRRGVGLSGCTKNKKKKNEKCNA
jgi:hypothetical protein